MTSAPVYQRGASDCSFTARSAVSRKVERGRDDRIHHASWAIEVHGEGGVPDPATQNSPRRNY